MGIASSYCMSTSDRIEVIRHKYELLRPLMTERMRRQWAACEAMSFPRGGFTLVAQATGLSRTTLWAGKRELQHQAACHRRTCNQNGFDGPVGDGIWSRRT